MNTAFCMFGRSFVSKNTVWAGVLVIPPSLVGSFPGSTFSPARALVINPLPSLVAPVVRPLSGTNSALVFCPPSKFCPNILAFDCVSILSSIAFPCAVLTGFPVAMLSCSPGNSPTNPFFCALTTNFCVLVPFILPCCVNCVFCLVPC